jgi:toxin ParE1/3/4
MAVREIRWLRRALANLDEIATYIAADNPAAARALVAGIKHQVALLRSQPNIGRPGRVPGTRELVIIGEHYIIPYRVKRNHVDILRVFHDARAWPKRF